MLFPYKSRVRSWWNEDLFPVVMHPLDSRGAKWSQRQLAYAWIVLIGASLCVLLPNLSYPLIEPDETRYAEIAIGMLTSRDWVNPMLDGEPYLDKPPLMYWLTAISFSTLGTHEIAARMPSMISAFLTIVFTFLLGSRVVGRRAAWLGAMSLALCGGFMLAGRFLILDPLLALMTTVCLLTGYIAVREQNHRWVWWMASGVACALGVLAKGPVALVLCAPPLIASGWLRCDQSRTRLQHWVAFVVPMIAVCVPWYIAVVRLNPEFIDHFFWEHNLKRFTQGSNHQQPSWFYVPIIFASMYPASLLLPSAVLFVFSRASRKRRLRSKDLGFIVCSAVWILVFFSVASCKLPTYILPAIPLLAIVIGVMLDQTVLRCVTEGGVTSHLRPFPKRASLILAMTCVVVMSVDGWLGGVSTILVIGIVGCLLLAGFILWQWNRPNASSIEAWAATCCVAVATLTIASAQLLPTIATTRSLYVKTKIAAAQHPNCSIVFFGEKPHGIQLQIDRGRVLYFPTELRDEFVAFVSLASDLIVIAADESIDSTRAAIAGTHELEATRGSDHLFFARRLPVINTSVSGATNGQTSLSPQKISMVGGHGEGTK